MIPNSMVKSEHLFTDAYFFVEVGTIELVDARTSDRGKDFFSHVVLNGMEIANVFLTANTCLRCFWIFVGIDKFPFLDRSLPSGEAGILENRFFKFSNEDGILTSFSGLRFSFIISLC